MAAEIGSDDAAMPEAGDKQRAGDKNDAEEKFASEMNRERNGACIARQSGQNGVVRAE